MGKQGPCYHCGVTSTPLWRNGPPEKPVLCNACGSRWRTKGSLANYTPLHARPEGDESDDRRVSKMKTVSLKRGDEKLKKRKLIYESPAVKREPLDYNQEFPRMSDEDTSNRSSYGSALSLSECSVQFSSADAGDPTGPAQSVAWEAQVPSKKRTCVNRTKSSPVELLIKGLHAVLHEQQSSYLSGSSEEDLIFDNEEPMVSVEIGHGSVLMKHPSSLAREEESEASSLSVENKPCALNEAYSRHVSVSGYNQLKAGNDRHSENVKNLDGGMIQQKHTRRDKSICEGTELLCPQSSPLRCIDLSDVVNFEVLMMHFTSKEQQQLLRYLPPPDTFHLPGSLQSMFESSYFKENLSCFQQLLSEGVFGNPFPGVKAEDFSTLKRLALSDAMKSKWAELYSQLKDGESTHQNGDNLATSGRRLGSVNKMLEEQYRIMPDILTSEGSKRESSMFDMESKETLGSDDGSFFTPKGMFGMPADGGSVNPNECSDQDLLLDVPPNACFPQAELLYPASSFGSHQTSGNSGSYTPPAMINH